MRSTTVLLLGESGVCHSPVVVSSGTAALHLAYAAAGIGPGDEVITSPLTFVATAHGIVNCGGTPVFADIEEETLNLNPDEIVQKITSKTKAIAPVHFAGHPFRVQKIREIARAKGAVIIEDGAHAPLTDFLSDFVTADFFHCSVLPPQLPFFPST